MSHIKEINEEVDEQDRRRSSGDGRYHRQRTVSDEMPKKFEEDEDFFMMDDQFDGDDGVMSGEDDDGDGSDMQLQFGR